METKIRVMEKGDVQAVMKIEKSVFKQPWSEDIFHQIIAKHKNYVMLLQEELIGYLVLMTYSNVAYLANFAIKKSFQNQGYGSRMLLFLTLQMKRFHCSLLYLDVRASNSNAIRLYQKLGFFEFQRIPNYYSNPQEDAIQMVLKVGRV